MPKIFDIILFQLAQAVRLFLEYSGSDYVDKNYVFTMDMADWLTEKFKLGLDFPNLPYLIDGTFIKVI